MQNNQPFFSGAISAQDCFRTAWEMIKPNYWLFFGIGVLYLVLLACVPCVNVFIMGPLWAGIYLVHFRVMRGENVDFGMLFSGFNNFVPTMIVGILSMIPEIIYQFLSFGFNFSTSFIDASRGGKNQLPIDSQMLSSIGIGMFVLLFLVWILIILWKIAFFFAIGLVADKNMDIFSAIKLSFSAAMGNLGGIILFGIMFFFLYLLGFVALCIGILFVIPVLNAASVVAFRAVFPDSSDKFDSGPPPPTMYQNNFQL